jgi:CMP-N,N'-diacetyllegionaminic acid synthase
VNRSLFLIPARGGSKGIPGKNIRPLNGKSLIRYSIDTAREITKDEFICVSTDSEEIRQNALDYGLTVPFMRPAELATDTAGTHEVVVHALDWYKTNRSMTFDSVVLLQPTSPIRRQSDVAKAIELFTDECDMVVSVSAVRSNLQATCFKEDAAGYLHHAFTPPATEFRRQDAAPMFQLNGSIYVMRVSSLMKSPPSGFARVKKLEMAPEFSVDIDEPFDWDLCEFLLQRKRAEL